MLTEAELIANLPGVCATIASGEPYTHAVFAAAPELRVISRTGVGYDAIDLNEAVRRNVAVGVTPGVNHDAVAEHTFALLLAIVKNVIGNHTQIAAGGFARTATASLRNKTLGLVGFGRIGRAVGVRGHCFGMRVLAADPNPPSETGNSGVNFVSLAELLAESDIISLHAPLIPETRNLIREENIARMKKGAIVLNTARGGLVDEQALADALVSGKLAGAGIDVFQQEPPLESPLLTAPNVILSPHLAGVDQQAIEDMAEMAAQTIVDVLQGNYADDRLVTAAGT